MAITRVNSTTTTSTYDLDGTFSVAMPTGTVQDDVMFTTINTYNGAPSVVPSGWTLVTSRTNASPSLATYVYWKLAGASEAGPYSWGLDPGFDLAANLAVHSYRGVNPTSPWGHAVSAVSTTAESLASGNVTVAYPGSWLFAVSGCRHSGTASCGCTMASMTERSDVFAADTAGSFTRAMATYDSNGEVSTGTATRTAVVGGTTLAHTVILFTIRPKRDLAETLTDNFNDNSIDSAKWTNGGGAFTAGATETGGQLQISDVVGGSSRKGLGSAVPYDLRGSSVQVQIAGVFTDPTSIFYPIRISNTSASDSTNYATIDVFNGSIRVVTSDDAVVYTATYNTTDHKFVRIREASGTVYFDRSPDGTTWTNMISQTTTALAFDVDEVYLSIQHFNGAAVGSSSTAAIDNFNIVPVAYTSNPTDVLALSDSASAVRGYARSTTDTESLSDSLSVARGYGVTPTDGEALSDALTASRGYVRSTSDDLSLSDSVSSVLAHAYSEEASDGLALSDSAVAVLGINASQEDVLGLTDSATTVQEFNRSASDDLGLTDSAVVVLDYPRSASDALGLTDDVSRVAEYSRSATEALSLSDTAVAALSVPRSTEDFESLSDGVTAVLDIPRDAADTVALSDSVSVVLDHVLEVSDIEGLADSAHGHTGTGVESEDFIDLNDSVSHEAEYSRSAADGLELADSLSAALAVVRSTDDSLELADALTAALSLPRSAADVVSLSDSVTISLDRVLEVSDSMDLSDQTVIDQEFIEIVSDLEDLSDSVGKHFSKVVSDDMGLSDITDTAGGVRLLERVDTLTLSDSVVAALYRTTVEPLERKALIGNTGRVTQTEDIERKWSIT